MTGDGETAADYDQGECKAGAGHCSSSMELGRSKEVFSREPRPKVALKAARNAELRSIGGINGQTMLLCYYLC